MSTKARVAARLQNSDFQPKVYDPFTASHGSGIWIVPATFDGTFRLEKLRLGLKTESASYTYLVDLCAISEVDTELFTQSTQVYGTKLTEEGNSDLYGYAYGAPIELTGVKQLALKYIKSNGSPFQWVAASLKDAIRFSRGGSLDHEMFLRIRFPADEVNSLKNVTDANEPRLAIELYGEIT